MRSLNIKYIPELDQLRGLAVLLVLFFHSIAGYYLGVTGKVWPTTNNPLKLIVLDGFTGVALFFILSGFLFTWGALHSEKIDWKKFYLNRGLRIYPMYILLLLFAVSITRGDLSFLTLIQDLSGFANLHGPRGDFDVVLWTISIELQFYMVFPFILGALKRKGGSLLIGLIAVFTMMRLVAYMSGVPLSFPSYWTMIGRIDQFLIGMFMAWTVYTHGLLNIARIQSMRKRWILLGLAGSSALVLAALWGYNLAGGRYGESLFTVVWPVVEAAVWGVFSIFFVCFSIRMGSILTRFLQFIGVISYSLYLLHWPIMKALHNKDLFFIGSEHHLAWAFFSTTFILLPIAIAAAYLTYRYIEKPPLELRKKYTAGKAFQSEQEKLEQPSATFIPVLEPSAYQAGK